jgi:cell division protein FtsB
MNFPGSGLRFRLLSLRKESPPRFFSRRKIATGAAAALALGVAYHVVFGANGLTAYERKRQETRSLNAQIESLRSQNELLKSHADRLANDPEAIEQEAREQLHYTRSGEVIYALPAQPREDADSGATRQPPR